MLADFSITGYIHSNIVKDSTKSAQPMYFLSPPQRGGAQAFTGPGHGRVGERRHPLEPIADDIFRYYETTINCFICRENRQTR